MVYNTIVSVILFNSDQQIREGIEAFIFGLGERLLGVKSIKKGKDFHPSLFKIL